jgi:hypothetical protein
LAAFAKARYLGTVCWRGVVKYCTRFRPQLPTHTHIFASICIRSSRVRYPIVVSSVAVLTACCTLYRDGMEQPAVCSLVYASHSTSHKWFTHTPPTAWPSATHSPSVYRLLCSLPNLVRAGFSLVHRPPSLSNRIPVSACFPFADMGGDHTYEVVGRQVACQRWYRLQSSTE